MKIKIAKQYMVLPVNTLVGNKEMSIKHNGEEAYSLSVMLDDVSPNFESYVDMSRYIGEEVEITIEPDMSLSYKFVDEINYGTLYAEDNRPIAHFTTPYGWINDPNGLVFYKGEYHLFYQYNPCAPVWGNMHWGHATSKDLIRWDNKNIALFPDKMGTMFSGSAIVDDKNASGLKKGDEDVILLFYTAAGNTSCISKGQKFTQCLAYSNDAGKTFEKYKNNPIVSYIEAENRDPKVVYCDEINKYIMALYLNDNRYVLLSSENLIDWETHQNISIVDENECPDFYPIYADNGRRLWVFSGAHHRYLIGEFKNGLFVPIQDEETIQFNPEKSYASQSFSNTRRRINISWQRPSLLPNANYQGQMSIPVERTLKYIKDRYYLCEQPISELSSIYENKISYQNPDVEGKFILPLSQSAYIFLIDIEYDNSLIFDILVFGEKITCDLTKNQVKFKEHTVKAGIENKRFKMTAIFDRFTAEIFVDEGEFTLTDEIYCDYNLSELSISGNKTFKLESFFYAELGNIWGNKNAELDLLLSAKLSSVANEFCLD